MPRKRHKALIGYGKLAEEMVKGYGERGFFFENEKDLSYLKKISHQKMLS